MDAQFKRYRQVAIFVSTLDRNAADSLLEQLPAEEAASVRRAILSLDTISEQEEAEVLAEFMRRGGMPAGQSSSMNRIDSGVELDSDLTSKFQSPSGHGSLESTSLAAPSDAIARATKPEFDCLSDIDGAWLAPLISQEHPQTIAVVVSHLPQAEAARLLGALSAEQQSDIIRRLTDLDEMDIDSLCLIERHLQERLSEHVRHKQRRTTGVSNVAAILRAADPITRNRLVKQLRLSDNQLADQLHKNAGQTGTNRTEADKHLRPYAEVPNLMQTSTDSSIEQGVFSTGFEEPSSFEQLAHWTERSLRALLKECQPELILLALTGADESIVRRVLKMFPAKHAATLRHALNHLGPTRLSDVEAAQQEIMIIAAKLEQAGRLASGTGRLSMAA